MDNHYPEINYSEIKKLEFLGRGAFGVVRKGKWGEKIVAIKSFFYDSEADKKTIDEELKQAFRIEEHKHIISVFGVSFQNSRTYLIMEYADSGSLKQFLFENSNKSHSKELALNWMYQCAQALAFLHATKPNPLLHRDLKPANLLLLNNYTILKLSDFGTVAELKSSMTPGKGSLAWTAPEVMEGNKYTEKCDVYSFGITAWEAMTREEFSKMFESPWAIPNFIRKGTRPKVKKNWLNNEKNLLISCWEAEPAKRLSMETVVKILKQICEDDGQNEPQHEHLEYTRTIQIKGETIDVFNCLTTSEDILKGLFGLTYKANWKKKTAILKEFGNISSEQIQVINYHMEFCNKRSEFLHIFIEDNESTPKYLLTEYAEGGSLYNLIHHDENFTYSMLDALQWLFQCASGISYIHSLKCVHRHLTSKNTFLTQNYKRLKIGFIASAKDLVAIKNTYKLGPWMAPEVHKRNLTLKCCDTYSWAVILWEALHREKLFDVFRLIEIIDLIKTGVKPVIDRNIPEELRNLMELCWHRDLDKRPRMVEVVNNIEKIINSLKESSNELPYRNIFINNYNNWPIRKVGGM